MSPKIVIKMQELKNADKATTTVKVKNAIQGEGFLQQKEVKIAVKAEKLKTAFKTKN